jgi:hypothetical protein
VTPRAAERPRPTRAAAFRHLWAPKRLAWWIAILFAVGSALFTLGGRASVNGTFQLDGSREGDFTLEGSSLQIAKLRMNSRWYGLRAHGDVFFDSRLDMAAEGGPVQRLENELGVAGDVLGEITETVLRARVTGTLGHPKIGIEVLRQGLHW